jgi:hypothetical protein
MGRDVGMKHWITMKMVRFLRRRGWVVFYLEKDQRVCKGKFCWLKLYEAELVRIK